MGLFDFGDRAMIKTLASHVWGGVGQLGGELDRSGGKVTPMARGLASALKKDIKEIMRLQNTLSDSSRTSILINMQGQNVQLPQFLFTLKMISDDYYKDSGIMFF